MMDYYRTAICTVCPLVQTAAVSAGHLADTEPQQRFAQAFWRETSPRLHPSLGDCRHTVLV